jgi:hypothetical protein
VQTVSFPGVTREIWPGLPLPAGEDDDDGVWVGAQAARTIVDSAATATIIWRALWSRAAINGFPLLDGISSHSGMAPGRMSRSAVASRHVEAPPASATEYAPRHR